MRRAFFAGQFYPGNKTDLKRDINNFFESVKLGKKYDKIFGAVVPHAGYMFSGKTAAYVYKTLKQIRQNEKPTLFVIFGANHSAYENIVISVDDFLTPLGQIKNSELSKKILGNLRKAGFDAGDNEREHSIEVQLPFLQEAMADKDFEIIPIIIREVGIDKCKKIATTIYNIIKNKSKNKKDKKIFVLASSDFTHYGAYYGFFNKNFQEFDKEAINKIIKLDSTGFFNIANTTTICGASAICCAIELCKLIGAKKGELLNFSDSSEVSGDRSSVVDYASIVFI